MSKETAKKKNDGIKDKAEKVAEEQEVDEKTPEAEADKKDNAEADKKDNSEEQTEKQSAEDEALNVQYMRLMADFQNYKKRVEKEKGDIYAYANEQIITELLTVIDSFERALEHSSEDESFAEGMKMIFNQLTGVLEKAGLVEIEAQGTDFDPQFHNAVMTEDNPDFESGKITEVLQKGYTFNSKVIRPSMVKVNN